MKLNLYDLTKMSVNYSTWHYFIIYKYADAQRRIIFRFELIGYEINDGSTAEIMAKAAFNFVYVTRIILLRIQFC